MRYPATKSISLLLLLAASALQAQSVNSATASAVTLSGNYTVASSGTTTFYKQSSGDLQFTGLITGGGVGATLYLNTSAADSLTTFTFSGANTFVGRIQLNRGSLVVNHLNALGNASNEVYLNSYVNNSVGNLRFNISGTFANPINNYESTFDNSIGVGSNNVILTGNIYGGGGLRKYGSGSLTVTGTNTYANGTYNYAGTLQIGNGGTTGTLGQGSVVNSGTLIFNRSNNFEVTNSISGSGSVEIVGTGRLDMRSTIGASGGLTIRSGTLRFVGSPSTDYLFGGTAVTVDGGTLDYGGYSESNAATVTLKSGTITNGIAIGTAYAFESGVASVVLGGTGSLTKTTAGTVTLSGTNTYSGTTTISAGTLQIGNGGTTGVLGGGAVTNNATLTFNRSNSMTVSNAISGTGSVVHAGTGTTTLSGSNTYSGGTIINAGTFALGTNNVLTDAGAVTINSGGVFSLGSFGDYIGTLTLNGNATVSGTSGAGGGQFILTQGQAGTPSFKTLTANGVNNTIATNIGISSQWGGVGGNANLHFNVVGASDTLTVGGVIADKSFDGGGNATSGAITKQGSGTLILTNDNTYTGGATISAGTLQIGNGGTKGNITGNSAAIVNNGILVVNRSDGFGLGNAISGTGALVQAGVGTTTVGGSNTFTGGTTVQAGKLLLGSANRFADGATLTVSGGSFDLGGFSDTVGTVTLSTGSITNGTLTGSSYAVQSGTISAVLAGNGALTKTGAGTVTLSGANTFTGGSTLTLGTLVLGASNRLADTGAVTVSGGSFDLGGFSDTVGVVTLSTGSIINGTLTGSSYAAQSGTVSAVLAGTGALTKTGAGTVTLSGANTYSGSTTIDAGILATSGADRIATGNSVTVNASGTFQLGGNQTLAGISGSGAIDIGNHILTTGASSTTFAGTISGNGALVKSGAGTLTLSGVNTYHGDTTVSAGTLILANANALARDAVLTLAAGATLTVNQRTFIGALDQAGGSINGAGELVSTLTLTNSGSLNAVLADGVDFAAGILKRTSGVTTVGAANTFTGTVKVQGGTLRLAQGGSFNSASTLVLSDGATMDLDGKSQGFSEVTGTAGTVALGSGTLTIHDATNTNFGGVITGTGSVTKTGAGRLELTGTNTYTGVTTIQNGELKLNGSLATSALSVAAPATLSGTGTIAGDVTITGTHTPGNSPGVQTIGGNLTYASGSLGIVWELAGNTAALADRGTVYDGIDVGGDLTVVGSSPVNLVFDLAGSTVDWSDTFWDTDKLGTDGWLLLDVGGVAYDANNLSIVLLDYLDSQGQLLSEVRANGAFSLQQVGSDIYLTYAAIPEPSTYGLILGGLALVGAAVRRRRKA